jgi:hypothetical protein
MFKNEVSSTMITEEKLQEVKKKLVFIVGETKDVE